MAVCTDRGTGVDGSAAGEHVGQQEHRGTTWARKQIDPFGEVGWTGTGDGEARRVDINSVDQRDWRNVMGGGRR